MVKATVVLQKVANAQHRQSVVISVVDALSKLGKATDIIPSGARVVVKPNITADSCLWEKGIITNPYTVEGIIEFVKQSRAKEIIIAEATAIGLDTEKGFIVNGYREVAVRTGARLIDLNTDETVTVPVHQGLVTNAINIAKTVYTADFLINVPAMKTHVATGVSLGMKNLKGILPAREKQRSHLLGVNAFVTDLNSIIKPNLCVIDGTIAMEGDGPMGGTAVNLGLIVAGNDQTATDIIATRVMGIDPWSLACFQNARAKNSGIWDADSISIIGSPLAAVVKPFRLAIGSYSQTETIKVEDCGACSGCREGVRVAINRLVDTGMLVPNCRIYAGENAQPVNEETAVIVGRCLNKYRQMLHYVPGCPPQVFLITDEIREMAGQKRIFGEKKFFLGDEG